VVVKLMMMVDFIGNQLPEGHIDLISMFLSCPPLDQQVASMQSRDNNRLSESVQSFRVLFNGPHFAADMIASFLKHMIKASIKAAS